MPAAFRAAAQHSTAFPARRLRRPSPRVMAAQKSSQPPPRVRRKNRTKRTLNYKFKCVHESLSSARGRPSRADKARRAAVNKLACGQTFRTMPQLQAHYAQQKRLLSHKHTGFCCRHFPVTSAPARQRPGKPTAAARALAIDTHKAVGLGGLQLDGPRAQSRNTYISAQNKLLDTGVPFPA